MADLYVCRGWKSLDEIELQMVSLRVFVGKENKGNISFITCLKCIV